MKPEAVVHTLNTLDLEHELHMALSRIREAIANHTRRACRNVSQGKGLNLDKLLADLEELHSVETKILDEIDAIDAMAQD